MNKQNLWFLTLFSLILILGVYYITLPSDIFNQSNVESVSKNVDVSFSENNKLVALRVERDEKVSNVMEELQEKIMSAETKEEKSSAFDELQLLNLAKGKETYLEDKLQNEFNINSYVEINGDNITITIAAKEHTLSLANELMRCIQEEFDTKKNITVKFES